MTLTDTAKLTKRVLIGIAACLILILIGIISYRYYYYNIYLPSLKPPVEKPDLRFGTLPPLPLPQSPVSSANFVYNIDTETGSFNKNLPNILRVYYIPQQQSSLLAPDKAKRLATNFGFNNGPELLSPTEYRYATDSGTFVMNLNTSNFNLQYNTATPSANENPRAFDEESIIKDFKNYLNSKNLLNDSLLNGKGAVIYNNANIDDSTQAIVSLFQEDIDKMPVLTPGFNVGLVRGVLLKYLPQEQRYTSVNYTYWSVDKTNYATYYVKPIDEAFTDLKNGKGYVAIEPKTTRVSITSGYLAYILFDDYVPFLQPVYVFEGNGYAGIVPAIQ
jgi:hypothetical protein